MPAFVDSLRRALARSSQASRIFLGMHTRSRAFTGPLWVQIGVSNVCNYRCIMCWDHPPDNELIRRVFEETENLPDTESSSSDVYPSAMMENSMFKDLIDDLAAMGTFKIDLVGHGEPLLNPSILEMVEYVKQKALFCTIVTNGSTLQRDLSLSLIKASLDRIVISLNTASAETYPRIHLTESSSTFTRIIDEISCLREEREKTGLRTPEITLSFVLSRLNYMEIDKMIQLCSQLDVDRATFRIAEIAPRTSFLDLAEEEIQNLRSELARLAVQAKRTRLQTNLNILLNDLSKTYGYGMPRHTTPSPYETLPCYVGWIFSVILADGTVTPCCECNVSLGNLKERRFREVWYSDAYNSFRATAKQFPKGSRAPHGCRCHACGFLPHNITLHAVSNPCRLLRASTPFKPRDLLRFLK